MNKLAKSRFMRQETLRVFKEIFGNMLHRIASYKSPSTPWVDIRPNHNSQQPLFWTVQKMTEEIAILMPTVNARRWRLPFSISTNRKIDDKSVSPVQVRIGQPVLTTQQITNSVIGIRRNRLNRHAIHGRHVNTFLFPSRRIICIIP